MTSSSPASAMPDARNGPSMNVKPGTLCSVINFYQSKPDAMGKTTWTKQIPDDLGHAAEDAETARHALICRFVKCYDGRRNLKLHSIVVQSQLLKKILAHALSDYPGITIEIERLEFSSPFASFVHRWHLLEKELAALDKQIEFDSEDESVKMSRDHLTLLLLHLQNELKEKLQTRDDFLANSVMSYGLLWTIFEPNCLLLAGEIAFKLKTTSYTRDGFLINGTYVDWDGKRFGQVPTCALIMPYEGTMSIPQLNVFPMTYAAEYEKVKKALKKQGELFVSLRGFQHKTYKGVAIMREDKVVSKVFTSGRIVIDASTYYEFNANLLPKLSNLTEKPSQIAEGMIDAKSTRRPQAPYVGLAADSSLLTDMAISHTETNKSNAARDSMLTDEELIITTPWVRGYSLKDKRWLSFHVDNVTENIWNTKAFDSLVLPPGQKDLVIAVAESQAESHGLLSSLPKHNSGSSKTISNGEPAEQDTVLFDDFIAGKGQGIILLLSGPPGTGKTLTAESVAEEMRVPLYMMSASDLGIETTEVEQRLAKVLKMVTNWNAVLLLDEADVFLAQRTNDELQRNMLVSVFLRLLEYYTGTLFLTSNRPSAIDEAFQSRIHIRLTYAPLTLHARRQIWREFIINCGRPQGHDLSDQDFDRLASERGDLNGRQIKNAVKTAVLLAQREKTGLKMSHLKGVLEIDAQK